MTAPLVYSVAVPDPRTHCFHVTLTVPDAPPRLRLVFPRWTPGSYLLREHGRHVEDLVAAGSAGTLAVRKREPHAWEVDGPGGEVTLSYRVYAHELTVRTAHLDDTHGFFNGVCLFFLPEGQDARPCTLSVTPPAGWQMVTTLPATGPTTFAARDYHHLVDCPVELGTPTRLTFMVRGIPHEVCLVGRGNVDEARLVADLPRLVEQNAAVFGALPYARYLFLVLLTDSLRGGLEHEDSTALCYPRFGFRGEKDYEAFLTLCTHEHFHAWNVKRIKPRAFTPYDYTRENLTRELWAYEGLTSYYDNLNTRRAGLMTPDRYLTVLGELVTTLLQTPGRKAHTLEDASHDAWIKYYRQDEHTGNSTVSYYLKGELTGLCLDLTLRQLTAGQRSLDDVMRLLWRWAQERPQGLQEGSVEAAAAEVAGHSLQGFFDRALRSTEELPLAECLAHVGLELHTRAPEGHEDKGGTPGKGGREGAWLGAHVRRDGTVQSVVPGGPALLAGLAPGDQVLALNGWRVSEGALAARLEDLRPGSNVTLHWFRRDELRTGTLTLAAPPAHCAFLRRSEPAPADRLALRRGWLGAE